MRKHKELLIALTAAAAFTLDTKGDMCDYEYQHKLGLIELWESETTDIAHWYHGWRLEKLEASQISARQAREAEIRRLKAECQAEVLRAQSHLNEGIRDIAWYNAQIALIAARYSFEGPLGEVVKAVIKPFNTVIDLSVNWAKFEVRQSVKYENDKADIDLERRDVLRAIPGEKNIREAQARKEQCECKGGRWFTGHLDPDWDPDFMLLNGHCVY